MNAATSRLHAGDWMPRKMLRGLAAGLIACGFATAAAGAVCQQTEPAATRTASAPKLYRIAGVVSDAATGKVLPGTTVTLISPAPRQTIQTSTADAEGRFAFAPVAAAKYSLTAARRGYIPSAFDEHDQYSSAIVTGDDQDTEHLAYRINAGATVRGIVSDEGGEPVKGAKVLMVRRTREGGRGEHFAKSIEGVTEDDGLFEFWDLAPGTYYVAVKAEPWFAVHPSSPSGGAGSKDAGALDVAYPLTYFAGTTEESSASPIELTAGARVEADIVLHAVPAFHLTVRSSHPTPAEPGTPLWPDLRQTAFGDEVMWNYTPRQAAEDEVPSTFMSGSPKQESAPATPTVYGGLAPGHYTLEDVDSSRVTELDLNGDQEVDLSSGTPVFTVALKARMADGSALPQPLEFSLSSDDARMRTLPAGNTQEDESRIFGVSAGRWIVQATGGEGPLAVVALQANGAPVADSRITVKDKSVTATVVLAQGKTSVEGFAKKDGKGEPGVMIVLVPRDPAAGLPRFRRDQSDSDGSFLLVDAVPGDYTIVAIEDGWDLDWASPEVISRYLAKGTPVTVSAKSGATMHLAAAVEVQPR